MKTYVLGDIHGNYKALLQVLERCPIDPEVDKLIFLGDVCDGYPQTKECVDKLLEFKNLIVLKSNHDEWALEWMEYGEKPFSWYVQGGKATIDSYGGKHTNVPKEHIELLNNGLKYYLLENENDEPYIFVHGGFNPLVELEENTVVSFTWDRNLINIAKHTRIAGYKHVFVGHTQTTNPPDYEPITHNNLTMLDTGAGYKGKLTIMDLESGEIWQSNEFFGHEKY